MAFLIGQDEYFELKNFIRNSFCDNSLVVYPHKNSTTQPVFTGAKLTIETLEQGVKYVES